MKGGGPSWPDGIRMGWVGCEVRYRDRFRKYLVVGLSQGALIGRFASRQCIPLGHLRGEDGGSTVNVVKGGRYGENMQRSRAVGCTRVCPGQYRYSMKGGREKRRPNDAPMQ